MKNSFIILIIISFTTTVNGQNGYIAAESNFSTFRMSTLKNVQTNFIQQSGLPLKAVDKFPAYFGWGGLAAFSYKKISAGIQGGFTSTGGRADYEDYSGIAQFDQNAKCYWVGPYFQVQLNKSNSWPIFFDFRGSFVSSKVDLTTLLIVGTTNQTDKNSFHSTNYGFRPEFSVRKNLKQFFIQGNIGYELQTHGKLYLTTNHQDYLQDGNGNKVSAQWNGFRFSLNAGFFFKKPTY